MRRQFMAMSVVALTLGMASSAKAHNVWCHCPDKDKNVTIEFFHHAGGVYTALSDSIATWHRANAPLEEGVLAEFEHNVDPTRPLQPELFRKTLAGLMDLDTKYAVLESRLISTKKFVEGMNIAAGFDETVTKVLAEDPSIQRLSLVGARYSDVGGKSIKANAMKTPKIKGISGILQAQIEDLKILRGVLGEVIGGLRDAMPLAEKGEFAKVMLSGRNKFGDKMPQLTNLISAYERLYVQTCMSTISATMQVYPSGFEWLQK